MKQKKLSPVEKDTLEKLENELRREQRTLQQNLEALKIVFDNDVRGFLAEASEQVKKATTEFNQAKHKLNLAKEAALRKAENDYEKGLSSLHAVKKETCDLAEQWLEKEKEERTQVYKQDTGELKTEFQKFLEDNQTKQKLIKEGVENV